MRKFKATARDRQGNKYAGVFEASDEEDAKAKLLAQKYEIISLEEVFDEKENAELYEKLKAKELTRPEKTAASLKKNQAVSFRQTKQKKGGLIKILAGAGLVLLSIPALIWLLSPGEPEIPAKDVLKSYFGYELKGAYDKQWPLLSDELKAVYQTPQKYLSQHSAEIKKRQSQYPKPETEPENKAEEKIPSLGDVVPVHEQKRQAELMTYVDGGLWQEHYLANLRVEGDRWLIVSVEAVNLVDLSRSKPKVKAVEKNSDSQKIAELTARIEQDGGKATGGIEEMKKKAAGMLETAYRQGKISEEEYLRKKKNLEGL